MSLFFFLATCFGPSLESESDNILRFLASTGLDSLLGDLLECFEAGDPLLDRLEAGEPLFECLDVGDPLFDRLEAGEPLFDRLDPGEPLPE